MLNMIISPEELLKISSPFVVAIIVFLLNKFFNNKPKLIAYYGHFSRHFLKKPQPNIPIFTHSVVVRNIGRLTATNVRLGHNKRVNKDGEALEFPEINIFPEVMYSIVDLPDGGKEIVFPTLVAKKQITVSYLYFFSEYASFNSYVECTEGAAEIIWAIPTKELPVWKKNILYVLLFIGASTTLYFAVRLLLILT